MLLWDLTTFPKQTILCQEKKYHWVSIGIGSLVIINIFASYIHLLTCSFYPFVPHRGVSQLYIHFCFTKGVHGMELAILNPGSTKVVSRDRASNKLAILNPKSIKSCWGSHITASLKNKLYLIFTFYMSYLMGVKPWEGVFHRGFCNSKPCSNSSLH